MTAIRAYNLGTFTVSFPLITYAVRLSSQRLHIINSQYCWSILMFFFSFLVYFTQHPALKVHSPHNLTPCSSSIFHCMYTPQFTILFINVSLGHLQTLWIVNIATVNTSVQMSIHVPALSTPSIYPLMGLQDHMANPYIASWGTTTLPSRWAAPFYFPTNGD